MGLPDNALFNDEPLIRRVPGICSNTYTRIKKIAIIILEKKLNKVSETQFAVNIL
jgi:hypothetical protein